MRNIYLRLKERKMIIKNMNMKDKSVRSILATIKYKLENGDTKVKNREV